MKKSLPKVLALFMAISMSLTGCGTKVSVSSQNTTSEATSGINSVAQVETSSSSSTAPTSTGIKLIDQAGREVVIENEVNKIVSCYYISSSTCIALGLTDKMIAVEAKANTRPIYAMAAPELLEVPNVGSAKEFNMEACIAMEPDLVILPKRLKDSAETMANLGIKVLLVSPESHEELVEMIRLIADATGTQDKAEKLIKYYDEQINEVKTLTAELKEKPAVYLAGNSSYLSTAPKGMYQATLIETAGGVNSAKDLEGTNWVDISYEQILNMNPDVIVIPAEASYSKSDVLNDTQLSSISAVKNGKVFEMPKSFETWDSPVPSCTLGIKWMLNVLHEDLYTIESLQNDVKNFYKDFYNVNEIDVSLISK